MLKRFIKELFPSYRASQRTLDAMEYLSDQIKILKEDIESVNNKNEYLFFLSQRRQEETELETRHRVFREMPKASGELRIIQFAGLFILQRIKEIYNENSIEFFLLYGTLIGAIRHQGFIPWDDDIDLGMMRQDFEAFKKALLNDDFIELKNYYCYYPNRSGYVTYKVNIKNCNTFFIDIFVWDYIDCKEKTVQDSVIRYNEINISLHDKLSEYVKTHKIEVFNKNESFAPVSIPKLDKFFSNTFDFFYSRFGIAGKGEYCCLGIEHSNFLINLCKIIPAYIFTPVKKDSVIFEGENYNSINDCEEFFRLVYGDIWLLPKMIKPHHLQEIGRINEQDIDILKQYGIIE